jgi:hypothetical protein
MSNLGIILALLQTYRNNAEEPASRRKSKIVNTLLALRPAFNFGKGAQRSRCYIIYYQHTTYLLKARSINLHT